jgi:hypothetical protein
MAIEVYQSVYAGNLSADFEREAFELATFFSNSPHFTIIDSYTSHWWSNRPFNGGADPPATYVAHRYKGDPIADTEVRPGGSGGPYKVWEDANDVGAVNNWFVIQCETTIHDGLPKWQAKIQWQEAPSGFADVSGLPYGTLVGSQMGWRFAAKGGWDLADVTPDFVPAGSLYRSSNNHVMYVGHGGSGQETRWFLVIDNGQLLRFNRRNVGAKEAMFFSGYMGDITPIAPAVDQPVPRIFLFGGQCQIATVVSNAFLPEDIYITAFSEIYGGLCFEDEAGLWVETGWTLPDGQRMINYLSQPNRHAPTFELDVLPYYVVTSNGKGMLGTIPLIGRGYGPGFMLTANKTILTVASGYCPFFGWDGVTDLNF